MINILLNEDTTLERFDATVAEMKRKFKHAKAWIDWHLSDRIAPCIFPAKGARQLNGFGNNTNAQEGAGRWIKHGYGEVDAHPNLEKAVEYVWRIILQIHLDYNPVKKGSQETKPRKGRDRPLMTVGRQIRASN